MTDNRQHLRYQVSGRAQLETGTPRAAVDVSLIDISAGGISFQSDVVFSLGSRGRLSFSVHTGEQTVSVAAPIDVRYCVLHLSRYRIGVQFVELDASAQKAIDAIIEARKRIVERH